MSKTKFVFPWCEGYPCRYVPITDPVLFRLAEISQAPKGLYVLGNSEILPFLQVAIVGSRMPSGYGIRGALYFSKRLTELGLVVTSGLARGIDGAAHSGCLSVSGRTIAVLGHGLDRIYPVS